jgi:hypothetical protein
LSDSKFSGVSNSATWPCSRTSTRVESMMVLILGQAGKVIRSAAEFPKEQG